MSNPSELLDLESYPSPKNAARAQNGKGRSLRELAELQQLLMSDARDQETRPADRAVIARSWCLLEDAKRCLLNRLKPGSWNVSQSMQAGKSKRPGRVVDVESVVRSLAARQSVIEPGSDQLV